MARMGEDINMGIDLQNLEFKSQRGGHFFFSILCLILDSCPGREISVETCRLVQHLKTKLFGMFSLITLILIKTTRRSNIIRD